MTDFRLRRLEGAWPPQKSKRSLSQKKGTVPSPCTQLVNVAPRPLERSASMDTHLAACAAPVEKIIFVDVDGAPWNNFKSYPGNLPVNSAENTQNMEHIGKNTAFILLCERGLNNDEFSPWVWPSLGCCEVLNVGIKDDDVPDLQVVWEGFLLWVEMFRLG